MVGVTWRRARIELRDQSLPVEDQKRLSRVKEGMEAESRGTRKRGGGSCRGVRRRCSSAKGLEGEAESLPPFRGARRRRERRPLSPKKEVSHRRDRFELVKELHQTLTLFEQAMHRLRIILIPHSHQTKMLYLPRSLLNDLQSALARPLRQVPHQLPTTVQRFLNLLHIFLIIDRHRVQQELLRRGDPAFGDEGCGTKEGRAIASGDPVSGFMGEGQDTVQQLGRDGGDGGHC